MLRLLGFLYSLGIWGTFGLLVYTHWNACVGIGGCAISLGVDFLLSLVWPFFWGGWIH
jgi:hypothetical protein